MASASPVSKTFHADHDAAVLRVMATLPEDHDALLSMAAELAKEIDAACVAGDRDAAAECHVREEAIIWKLNDGTRFNSVVIRELIGERCGAAPGEVPLWGQAGDFVVCVDGMRVRVEKSIGRDLRLTAVDLDKPFLSATGFRSALSALQIGQTVEKAVEAVVREIIAENGRLPIAREYRDHRAASVPAWVAQVVAQDRAGVGFVEKSGQMAFAF